MLGFLPWMDEVHIVEMGRNFLSSGSSFGESILLQPNGLPAIPPYYIGPTLQELLFMCFGQTGTRLSPIIGLILAAVAFGWFMKSCGRYSRMSIIATSILAVTLPLFVQSTRLVRIDTIVFFFSFLACGLLAKRKYKTAAIIAAATPFIWPTAVMLFPMFLLVHIENHESHKKLIAPVLIAIGVSITLLLPLIHIYAIAAGSLSQYFATYGGGSPSDGCFGIVQRLKALPVPIVKETLRAPFFFIIAYAGILLSFSKRMAMFSLFSIAVIIGIATGMHTFRYVYLMPYFLLFAADAIEHFSRRNILTTRAISGLAIAYGVICGPIAYAIADLTYPAYDIDRKTAKMFADIPRGTWALTNGYSTYYSLRKLGILQTSFPDNNSGGSEAINSAIIDKCEFAILESEDKYAAIEESYTLYAFIRNLCLEAARRESLSTEKSMLAKIGEAFAYGTKPSNEEQLVQHGFYSTQQSFAIQGREYRLLKKRASDKIGQ